MAVASTGLELRRSSLLERLEKVQPKILALLAPAGFGKSTLTRQLLASKSQTAVCDAFEITDELDLARRLIPALAVEQPEQAQTLTQRELMLADPGIGGAERLNLAVEAWKTPVGDTTFVFENAEHIARNPAARELLARLLASRPAGRSIVICSRESLRLHLTRFAPPHEILTLRANELAFDSGELGTLFQGDPEARKFLPRIMELSQGWPIAVFLLKRFANEGRLDTLLRRLGDIAFEELHDYLADQVLASLDTELVESIFYCACIPQATVVDLQPLIPDDRIAALMEFAKDSPFVSRGSNGTFVVHPLVQSLLVERRADRRNEVLLRVASAHAAAERYPRAAELHLARGDQSAAAHALGQHEVIRDRAPSMEYARVLASLKHELVQRYPRLWAVTAMLRMFCVDTETLLDEAESLWRTLDPSVSALERYYILIFRVLFMSYIGLLEEALSLLERFAKDNEIEGQARNEFEGYVIYLLGLMRARAGNLTQGEQNLTVALPLISHGDAMRSGVLLSLGADVARPRGEFAVARQFVERALESAHRAALMNFVAAALAEGAFGAWLSGDDAGYLRYSVELDEVIHRNGVAAFSYFASVTRDRSEDPDDGDLLKWVVCGRIIAAASAPDQQRAVRAAKAAVGAAEQYGSPFVSCLAYITLAVYDEARFTDWMAEAAKAAGQCDSHPLQLATRAIAERRSDFGMLNSFMARLQRIQVERPPILELELTTGIVRSTGRDIVLPERELALLTLLALRRETVPRSRLTDVLWPGLDEYAARNALGVCLHRLRHHLGNQEAIVRFKDGYALHDDVRVDLWEAERIVAAVRLRPALGDLHRASLMTIYEKLRRGRLQRMMQWEWFAATERHLSELRLEVAHRLSVDALSHGNIPRALELAEDMIRYDPCDEAARQIAITAHLRRGDRASALRQYRQYRETLLAELQCEPSDEIKHLVGLPSSESA